MWCLSLYTFLATATGAIAGAVTVIAKRDYFGSDSAAAETQAYFDAVSAALSMLLLPVFGAMADSAGRRPFLILLCLCTLIPYFILGVVSDDMLLYIATMAIAMTLTGNKTGAPVVTACLADVYPAEERAFAMSIMVACTGIGLVAAPIGTSAGISRHDLFRLCAVLATISGVMLLGITETLGVKDRIPFHWRGGQAPTALKNVMKDYKFRVIMLIMFCAGLPEAGLMETVLFYLNDRFGFTEHDTALFIAEFGLFAILASTIVIKVMLKYMSELRVMQIGLIMNLIHLLGYVVAWNETVIYVVVVPCAALSFVTFPAAAAIISRGRPASEQGSVMGIGGSVKGLTMILGPLCFGVMYNRCKGPPVNLPQAPMMLGALLVFIAVVLSFTTLREEHSEVPVTMDPVDSETVHEGYEEDKGGEDMKVVVETNVVTTQ
jgi:MFS family permease